jgi:hypothetical protein
VLLLEPEKAEGLQGEWSIGKQFDRQKYELEDTRETI